MPGSCSNPLKHDALTAETVDTGTRIVCWAPSSTEAVRHLTVIDAPYIDEDGDMVVEVRHADGHTTVELTSTVGLSGDRYTGRWTIIATLDNQDEA